MMLCTSSCDELPETRATELSDNNDFAETRKVAVDALIAHLRKWCMHGGVFGLANDLTFLLF